jgi:hypothetical protein
VEIILGAARATHRPATPSRCPRSGGSPSPGAAAWCTPPAPGEPFSGGYSSPQNGQSSSLCAWGASRPGLLFGSMATVSPVSGQPALPDFSDLQERRPDFRADLLTPVPPPACTRSRTRPASRQGPNARHASSSTAPPDRRPEAAEAVTARRPGQQGAEHHDHAGSPHGIHLTRRPPRPLPIPDQQAPAGELRRTRAVGVETSTLLAARVPAQRPPEFLLRRRQPRAVVLVRIEPLPQQLNAGNDPAPPLLSHVHQEPVRPGVITKRAAGQDATSASTTARSPAFALPSQNHPGMVWMMWLHTRPS